uniref:PhoLip_ATPase_C domain-containing protein n=1 Tax=Caenorhabditis tropicalis TaxID=1561998 RepID=A0A1I7UWF0_9PELO
MATWLLDKIEDFLEKKCSILFMNRYSLLTVGYAFILVLQVFLFFLDASFVLTGLRKTTTEDGIDVAAHNFFFSFFYGFFFLLIEPEDKRWCGAIGILTTVYAFWYSINFFIVFMTTGLSYGRKDLFFSQFSMDTVF